jgi:hypothetical protein
VPHEDKRRRFDGSSAQLSVADLLARSEAETQPIPVVRDTALTRPDNTDVPVEDTVKFAKVRMAPALTGHELHITELLRREGRGDDAERSGLSIGKLVAIASGGVVLCGSVAFGASQWLSSPNERPLAEVKFDTRPAARTTSTATMQPTSVGAPAPQSQTNAAQDAQSATATEQRTADTGRANAAQPAGAATDRSVAAPDAAGATTQAPAPSTGQAPKAIAPPVSRPSVPPSVSLPSPVPSLIPSPAPNPSPSPNPAPAPSPSPAPSSGPTPALSVDLGGILNPIGGFDFFTPAK